MADLSFVNLYVADVAKSQAFYADILGKPAIEASTGFAMFPAAPGVMLGLWRADEVEPPATKAGGSEICLTAESEAAVEATAAAWAAKGVTIALKPTGFDFGYAFVALDPDGHRVRVFMPRG
jgi:catechol 2,3-dioxygenase-like lactoylglutathione lyase family enzyme